MNNQVIKASASVKADYFIDITSDVCPMTFVKTKLKLEQMEKGQVLEVRLQGTEPLENVPRSVKDQGDSVLDLFLEDENSTDTPAVHRLVIRRDQ